MKRKSVSRGESPGSGKQADVGSVAPVAAAAAMPPVCTADVPDEAEPQPKRTSQELQKASDNGDDSDSDSTRRFHANSLRILITDTRDPSFIKSYFLRHPAYEASWMDNWFRREQWETHDRVLRHWKSLCMDGQQLYVPDVRDPIINEHVLLRDETPGVTSTDVWAFIEKQIKDEVEVKAEQHMDYQIHLMLVRAPCPRCLVSVFAAGSVRAKALRVGSDCVCVQRPSEFQDTRKRPLRIYITDFRDPERICYYYVGLRGCDDSSDAAKYLMHKVEGLDEGSQALHVHSVAQPIKQGCVLLCDGKLFKKDVIADYDSGSDSDADEPYYTDGHEASRVISSEDVWCFLRRHMNRKSNGVDEGVGKACDANMHITLVS